MNSNISVRENRENMLFNRKELKIDVESDTTPSREDAKKIVGDAISVSPELVRIIKVDSKFGENVFTIIAEAYDSEESFKKYSPSLKKKDIEAEKKAAEEKLKKESPDENKDAKESNEEAGEQKEEEKPSEEEESKEESEEEPKEEAKD